MFLYLNFIVQNTLAGYAQRRQDSVRNPENSPSEKKSCLAYWPIGGASGLHIPIRVNQNSSEWGIDFTSTTEARISH